MRHFLTFLFGAATASAWWSYAMWPNYNGGFLMVPAVLTTVIALLIAFSMAIHEDE